MRLPWRSDIPAAAPLVRSSCPPTASRTSSRPASTRCSPRPAPRWRRSSSTTGRPTAAGEIAEEYAARDVAHPRRARRQRRSRRRPQRRRLQVRGDYLDVPRLRRRAAAHGVRRRWWARWTSRAPTSPPARSCAGRRRRHQPARAAVDAAAAPRAASALRIADRPEILGDVFAWNKVFRRSFWDAAGLAGPRASATRTSRRPRAPSWPARFDVRPRPRLPLAHPRRRLLDHPAARPRCRTSPTAGRPSGCRYAACTRHGDADVEDVFVDRVLAGDLWRYFLAIPGRIGRVVGAAARRACGSSGASARWCAAGCRPCTGSAGWLVEQDRRADAAALMAWAGTLRPARRRRTRDGPALDDRRRTERRARSGRTVDPASARRSRDSRGPLTAIRGGRPR